MLKKATLSFLFLLTFIISCGTKQPKVEDPTYQDPKKSLGHLNLKTGCAECHEFERDPPAEDLVTVIHGEGQDCSTCHTWPLFKNINASVKAHNPYPKKCLGCHSRAKENSPHVPRGDCTACHAYPAWSPQVIGGKK